MLSRGSILLVMDHRALAESLGHALADQGFELGAEVTSLVEALEVCRERSPELMLVDESARPEPTALQRFKGVFPELRVLLLSRPLPDRRCLYWLEAGADGFVSFEESLVDLSSAIEREISGETLARSPRLMHEMFTKLAALDRLSQESNARVAFDLTDREVEILALLEQHLSNRRIAEELCLSVHTVKNHVHHVLSKMGATSRWDAVQKASSLGSFQFRRPAPDRK